MGVKRDIWWYEKSAEKYMDLYRRVRNYVTRGLMPIEGEVQALLQSYDQTQGLAAEAGLDIGLTGSIPAPSSIPGMQGMMANSIIQGAMTEAGMNYDKMLADLDKYGVDLNAVWDNLSAEVKGVIQQGAEAQRGAIETGASKMRAPLEQEIEDLTADYEKALGYFDQLLSTGAADPKGRISRIRSELEYNFNQYLGQAMDFAQRQGSRGRTMMAAMPKTQEAFFRSMVPMVQQEQDKAFQAGYDIAGQKAGLTQWRQGERRGLRGALSNIGQWEAENLADIERRKTEGLTGLAGTVATGKAAGMSDVMGKKADVTTQKAALPIWGAEQNIASLSNFGGQGGATTTLFQYGGVNPMWSTSRMLNATAFGNT